MKTYLINGRVIDHKNHFGIAGLRVEAWDKDLLFDDFTGSAVTDEDGAFQITFEESHFQKLFLDRKPDLFFKIFHKEELIGNTKDSILWNVSKRNTLIMIEVVVDEKKADQNPKRTANVVHGSVTGPGGKQLAGAEITIWRKLMRSRSILGAGLTSSDGNYTLHYYPPLDLKGKLLVFIEARSKELFEPLESQVVEALHDLEIDLHEEPIDQSEFTTTVQSMKLFTNGLELTDLVENDEHHDLSFIANDLGKSAESMMKVVFACRLGAAFGIPAAAFYAFLIKPVPVTLPGSLLEASQNFTRIDELITRVSSLIFTLTADVQKKTIESALKQNSIGPHFEKKISELVNQLQAKSTITSLSQPYLAGKYTLEELLDISNLPKEKKGVFANALSSNTQSMDDFWKTHGDGQHGFTSVEVSALKLTFELGAFVKNHVPLIQLLFNRFQTGDVSHLSDLARLSIDDWEDMVKQTGVPEGADAEINKNNIENFALGVYARVTRAFPTLALSSRLVSGEVFSQSEKAALKQFFLNNKDLDLLKHNLNIYLKQAGEKAYNGIDSDERIGAVSNAKQIQRVLFITADVDSANTLFGMGIKSATQVAMMGRQQFLNRGTQSGLSTSAANQIYNRASRRYAELIARFCQYNREVNGIMPKALGDVSGSNLLISQTVAREQSLSTLFGSQDYCETEFSTSILSPAAYLCDLLYWLREQTAGHYFASTILDKAISESQTTVSVKDGSGFPKAPPFYVYIGFEIALVTSVGGSRNNSWTVLRSQLGTISASALKGTTVKQSALLVLNSRRPDISNLKLNRQNTEVPLPYIDLINEILSDAVRRPKYPNPSINHAWKQTSSENTAADLRAAPEYFDQDAFITIFEANYPHSLPYSEGLDELRAYLQQSGIALWQLRKALLPLHFSSTIQQRELQISVIAERFRMTPNAVDLIITPYFKPELVWNSSDPYKNLALVPAFMKSASITYDQLLELLGSDWVQGGLNITISGVSDSCDTSIQTLIPSPLDKQFLDRAHRFLRLWRLTGYKMWELDVIMKSIGNLDRDGFYNLGTFRFLQDETKLSVDEQLAWFQPMDTNVHRGPHNKDTTPLYSRIYLNPAIVSLHPDADLLAIAYGKEMEIKDRILSNHLDSILASISISASDANLLITKFGLDKDSEINPSLSLKNLSLLYRIVQLAGISKVSVPDLISISGILNPEATNSRNGIESLFINSFTAVNTLKQIKSIQQSGFGIDELAYLLSPPGNALPYWTSTTAMPDATIATILEAVRQAITDPGGSDVIGNVIIAIATQFNIANDIAALLLEPQSFVAGATYFPGEVVVPVIPNGSMYRVIGLSGEQVSGPEPVWPNGFDYTPFFSGSVCFQWVDPIAGPILRLQDVPKTLMEILTDPALIKQENDQFAELSRTNYPEQFMAIQLLDKVRIIVSALQLVKSDLIWLLSNAKIYGGINIAQLPVKISQKTIVFNQLETTALLVKLSRLFTFSHPSSSYKTLYDIIFGIHTGGLANEAAAQTAISTITGWGLDNVSSFCSALGITYPDDYKSPLLYETLRTLMAMISAMSNNASGAQLIEWSVVPKDEVAAENMAASALKVLKSRYTNPDWLNVAPAIMNPLRENRSAALQDYLIGNGDRFGNNFADVNALFDYFLIDTQMGACEVTTRVVQAYVAVQVFVERCKMNLETDKTRSWTNASFPLPEIQIEPDDEIWGWWEWMKRYRIWEAARKVFLYPENWLIESQRINRTEIFKKLEQEVHQNEYKADYFEKVTLNYLDGLEDMSTLQVVGTCQDDITGNIHVVARSDANPPKYFHRKQSGKTWEGWNRIPLNIKSNQVVPYIFRGRLCLFWFEINVNDEPHPNFTEEEEVLFKNRIRKYVSITLYYSIFRHGAWSPAQTSKGKLFDIPFLWYEPDKDNQSTEYIYTLKVKTSLPTEGYGSSLLVDVFRWQEYLFRTYRYPPGPWITDTYSGINHSIHIGRGVFNGKFSDLELNNIRVPYCGQSQNDDRSMLYLFTHAKQLYGTDAKSLQKLPEPEPSLLVGGGLPQDGALVTTIESAGNINASLWMVYSPDGGYSNSQIFPMLDSVAVPFRVILPADILNFDPDKYFFFQDDRRCYYVQPTWSETTKKYLFHRFYHPYINLLWHQLGANGFKGIFSHDLQQKPDEVELGQADKFSFYETYQHRHWLVDIKEDNEILDFTTDAAYSVYNWELFFHIPLYISELLVQNQQFEDAMKWFHYIFNPTQQGSDPQRFWITKPLHNLNSITEERINNLLKVVNEGDQNTMKQVSVWRNDPFNPFLIADIRPAAYMKSVVMKYLDNLIAWADNLFATDSREALGEATLLYVIASEILGPKPSAITPPKHADDSYNQLAPKLDSFANAMVEIENTIGGNSNELPDNGNGQGIPGPQTFYFKIPSNEKLLGYWDTVQDRLFKLRHCQSMQGSMRELALFDAPIDPALLIKARAAGIDISSVLQEIFAPLPNYRYTALYSQALDFVNAVRSYGSSIIGAIEKSDSSALSLIQQTTAQQLLIDGVQVLDWQLEQTGKDLDAVNQAILLAQAKCNFNKKQEFCNAAEGIGASLKLMEGYFKVLAAASTEVGKVAASQPIYTWGGTPMGGVSLITRGDEPGKLAKLNGIGLKEYGDIAGLGAFLASTIGSWQRRTDNWKEAAKEANISVEQAKAQKEKTLLAIQIAKANKAKNQKQIDNLQQQLDFLLGKFTSKELYDWMVGQLAEIYFQSYKLAYRMCKQVEKCYQYELGIPDSNFIQFGYWDSLHKGLLSGETLNHDLRRMHFSYLEKNTRRFELSRYISLAAFDWEALKTLLSVGSCEFSLPESLFDNDYPGHFNRHLLRMSITVVYASPGKFDNVKATLTLTKDKVRTSDKVTEGIEYPESTENPGNGDNRFVTNYCSVKHNIALSNAQDDSGLFQTALSSNMADSRYLPFEGAGVISDWRFEMPQENNEIDLSSVSDVILHLYYTAQDGCEGFKTMVKEHYKTVRDNQTQGFKVFSARNDFSAASPSAKDPYPQSPWDKFLTKPTSTDEADQSLELKISSSKFPAWTRGKTISITLITVLTVAWPDVNFTIQPQGLLLQDPPDKLMTKLDGLTEPIIHTIDLSLTDTQKLLESKWTFKLKTETSADFRSLIKSDIGDLLIIVQFNTV